MPAVALSPGALRLLRPFVAVYFCYLLLFDLWKFLLGGGTLFLTAAVLGGAAFLFMLLGALVRGRGLWIWIWVCGFAALNAIGVAFGGYDLRYEYAVYRLMPAVVAFVAIYFLRKEFIINLLKVVLFGNFMVVLVEVITRNDLFSLNAVVNVVSIPGVGVVARVNGIYWYSLVMSSTVVCAAAFLCQQGRQSSFIWLICFSSILMTLNRFNILLLAILFFVYGLPSMQWKTRIVAVLIIVPVLPVILYLFWPYFSDALNLLSTPNKERFYYWAIGWEIFLKGGWFESIWPSSLGISGEVGNGFESQYIQILVEYGMLGCIWIISGIFIFLSNTRFWIFCVVVFGLITLRNLDSYPAAIIIYYMAFSATIERSNKCCRNEGLSWKRKSLRGPLLDHGISS